MNMNGLVCNAMADDMVTCMNCLVLNAMGNAMSCLQYKRCLVWITRNLLFGTPEMSCLEHRKGLVWDKGNDDMMAGYNGMPAKVWKPQRLSKSSRNKPGQSLETSTAR